MWFTRTLSLLSCSYSFQNVPSFRIFRINCTRLDCNNYLSAMKNTKVISKHSFMTVWISLLVFKPVCCSENVKIIKSRASLRSNGFKENAEAELSLFTESLGFINDEHLQESTPTHNFFKKLIKLNEWNAAADTKITEEHFVEHGVKLCTTYLSDPVFYEHEISLLTERHFPEPELKFVKFHYSSRKLALVKVIKCHIRRYLPYVGAYRYISRLYFQEIRHSDRLSKLERGYFVFANKEGLWERDDPLQLLMYTSCNRVELPPLDETGIEVAFSRPKWPDREGFKVEFNGKKLLKSQEVLCIRLFGEEAELVFLMKQYGFVNHGLPLWQQRKIIQIMDRLKKGYEVNAAKLQGVKQSDPFTVCKNYINNNDQLKQRGIRTRNDMPGAKVGWVSTSVLFPGSAILPEGDRKLELLQCPVTFYAVHLFILPVHYLNSHKVPQVFAFKEVEQNTNKVIPFLLSPVNEKDFEKNDKELPTNLDQEHKNTETISDEAKAGPSSHPPPPNLMDADVITTEITSEPGKPGPSRLSSDLIDFTDSSPQWTDIPFTYRITKNWEKFDSEEEKGES